MKNKYPYSLNNAFFVNVNFSRAPDMAKSKEFEATVNFKVVTDRLPERLQLNLKLESGNEQAVTFLLELVGLFDIEEGCDEPSQEIIYDFVNQRALYIMWPYIVQMSRILTAQMGMNPLNWHMPKDFTIALPEEANDDLSPEEDGSTP